LTSARRGLKGGRVWVDHRWEHRSREDLLTEFYCWFIVDEPTGKRRLTTYAMTRELRSPESTRVT
jgi:hypothetical protein